MGDIMVAECKVCKGAEWLILIEGDFEIVKAICSNCGHTSDRIGRFTHDIDNRKGADE
jgi:hypothetical protein